jgi:hypothetical protein
MRQIFLSLFTGVCGLVIAASGASAFSEVDTAPSVPGIAVTEAPAELREGAGTRVDDRLPALRMIDPSASSADNGGTVLSIPGIGRIGTLPKFDFGLELLYGAPDGTRLELEDKPAGVGQATEDDVIIRGTIKHRF